MKYLFDASALLNIVRRLGEKSMSVLRENGVLTLTIYEVGNVLWKETKLLKRLTMDEAEEIMRAVIALTRFMHVIEEEDPIHILRTSNEVEITFYDAAYVVTALRRNLTLVTDDGKLASKIEKNRDIISKEYGKMLHVIGSTSLLPRR